MNPQSRKLAIKSQSLRAKLLSTQLNMKVNLEKKENLEMMNARKVKKERDLEVVVEAVVVPEAASEAAEAAKEVAKEVPEVALEVTEETIVKVVTEDISITKLI